MPPPSKQEMDAFAERMRLVDVELKAIEEAAKHVHRIRCTPPVDDDFPQVKFEYDQSVRALVDALRDNKRFDGRLDLQR